VAAEVWARYRPPGVCLTATDLNLPIKRGLSSSAAICVLIARAFNQVHGLGLSVREEMELAYRGRAGHGLAVRSHGSSLRVWEAPGTAAVDGEAMQVDLLHPQRALYLLIVDLRRDKDTRRILADLHACFVAPADDRRQALRAALGQRNEHLVGQARTALEAGDAAELGELMLEAQRVFDAGVAPACPTELRAPRLHAVLAHPAARELAWGGKGVGSQGDGAAQFVCRGPEERAELSRLLTAAFEVNCLPLTIAPEAVQSD